MSKQKYRYKCKVCDGQELWLKSVSRWSYAAQRCVKTDVDPEYDAHCHDCDEYVDWYRHEEEV